MKHIQLFRPYYRTNEVLKELKKSLDSGWTGLGPVTKLFEQDIASYLGVKYVKMVNSGTAGLHLALKLLNLEEGSEVITTPLTFVSTNHVLLYEKLKPVFCDVRQETGCIDERKIEELITENTRAIMVVHYGGLPANMDAINRLGRIYNLPIIEDSAHAFGSSYRGHKIGDSPNICVFSFHPVKPLPTSDSGAVTTNNRLYKQRLDRLCWLGIDKSTYDRSGSGSYTWEYNVPEVGYKYHGNDLVASVARVSMRHVDEDLERRKEIVQMYREGLKDLGWLSFVPSLGYLAEHPECESANHLCVVRVPKKPIFMERMKAAGIECGCHYTPNTRYPMYAGAKVPVVDKLYEEIVSLPLHMMLTDKDVQYIIKTVREIWD